MNMNKYFIVYPKTQLYICFDGRGSFLNFKFNYGNEYLCIYLIYKNSEIGKGIKKLFKFKDKSSALYLTFSTVINNYESYSKKYDRGEFKYTIVPKQDKDLIFKNGDHPNIIISNYNCYYDIAYFGKMIDSRLNKKLPVIYLILKLCIYFI